MAIQHRDDPKETPAQKAEREKAEQAKRSPNAMNRQQEPQEQPANERGRQPGQEPPPLGSNIANPGGVPRDEQHPQGQKGKDDD